MGIVVLTRSVRTTIAKETSASRSIPPCLQLIPDGKARHPLGSARSRSSESFALFTSAQGHDGEGGGCVQQRKLARAVPSLGTVPFLARQGVPPSRGTLVALQPVHRTNQFR